MHIGGFQPFTLSDFPGRAAAIVFTQGCNYRCPFCHNGALWPIASPNAIDAPTWTDRAVLEFLASRRGRLEGLVVSGGEPTLQSDLADFLRQIKTLGFATKLDTNGSRPSVLRRLFDEQLLDYVAMDVKGPADRYARLAGVEVDLTAIEQSIALIAESGVAHHFRTTWIESLLRESDREGVLALLPPGSRHIWQAFRPELAVDAALRRSA